MIRSRFFQRCPVCGRGMLIPIEQLGDPVSCSHCSGHFHATDASACPPRGVQDHGSLMRRANELLVAESSDMAEALP
ncbi:hypothetical protein Pla52o_17690 [Novipirellula galeiformis]|uniref:Uncharacterized protein n=1 Tax=Novipirellula galeiformis TaxID=2528004 RepID=A0A5C6CM30_9BACT|nr:hypothetical protein [Novipirellula galeiformis]TWU25468.1 hypothetical protein Pla52o_17690 [Novipirellula galeiformis]